MIFYAFPMAPPKYLPITPWHQYLLDTYFDPKGITRFRDSWTLTDALHIRPACDVRALRRAVDRVLRRHDTLRLRFVETGGNWQAQMQPTLPEGLVIEEHGEMDECALHQCVNARAAEPIDLLSDQLVDIRVLRFGAMGDVVLLRIHHAIVDGYGIVLLIEELIKTMLRMPLAPTSMGYEEYLDYWYGQSAETLAERKVYWDALLDPVDPAPDFGSTAGGRPPPPEFRGCTDAAVHKLPMSDAETRRIMETAALAGTSFATISTAAFCEGLCTVTGLDRIYYTHVLGRSDGRLMGYLGEHTMDPILRYHAQTGLSAAERGRGVMQLLGESADKMPSETSHPACAWEHRIYEGGGFARQFGSWLDGPAGKVSSSPVEAFFLTGEADSLTHDGLQLSRVPLPELEEPQNELTLKIDHFGELPKMSFVYDAAWYSTQDLERLWDNMPW